MIVPDDLYNPTPSDIQRNPPSIIVRRGIQAGSSSTPQTVPCWEGDQARHMIISSLNLRVSITPDGATATKLEIARCECIDIASGTLATVLWEAIWLGSPAGLAVENPALPSLATGWVLAAGGANQQVNFDLSPSLRGCVVPNGTLIRFTLSTTGGSPVLLGGTSHLIGIAIPQGGLPR